MKVHASNLIQALKIAIEDQEHYEKTQLNYTKDSAFLAGIKSLKQAVKDGETLEIIYPIDNR